jgi:hypothetical protein
MTTNPNLPVALSSEELIEVLEDVLAGLREHDSFGGFLNYDALAGPPCSECENEPDMPANGPDACSRCGGWGDEPLPEGKDFWVRAGYRIGNSMGQGGMRFVCGEET